MKIRRYMLRFVEKAGDRSIQVPTILELTKKFNVSRPTVSKAMKALTEDGYIIGHRGIGGFTNPAKFSYKKFMPENKTVGILVGDGMVVRYGMYYTKILGEVLLSLACKQYETNLIQLSSHQTKRIIEEITVGKLDVVLWINPIQMLLPAIDELRRTGIKVITTGRSEKGNIDNVLMDYEDMGKAIGKALIAEGRRKVLYLFDHEQWSAPLTGLKQAYDDAGIKLNSELFISDSSLDWDDLRELIILMKKLMLFLMLFALHLYFYHFISRWRRRYETIVVL